MNKSAFFNNLLEYSKVEDYLLFVPGEQLADPKQMSFAKRTVLKAIMGVGMTLAANPGLGYLISQNSFNLSTASRESLTKDLEIMLNHCDLAGVKSSFGSVVLLLAIDADDITNESLIGHFAFIHEHSHNFRQYADSLMQSRIGNSKLGVFTQVVTAFSTHKRSSEFIENVADKCKHTAFWKKVYTQVWAADLENEEVKIIGLPMTNIFGGVSEKFKKAVFRK